VRLGVSPQINALATLFLAAVALLVTVASRLLNRPTQES
jgi:ABC-type spermidine/putrescine transport system permease subunit II